MDKKNNQMLLVCDVCNDKLAVLIGYPKAEQWTCDWQSKHGKGVCDSVCENPFTYGRPSKPRRSRSYGGRNRSYVYAAPARPTMGLEEKRAKASAIIDTLFEKGIDIEVGVVGKPRILLPVSVDERAITEWLRVVGVHTPACKMTGNELLIPRNGKRAGWMDVVYAAQAQGLEVRVRQQYRVHPSTALCSDVCKNAKLGESGCTCVCGGVNHASGKIGELIKNFHCTVEIVEVSPTMKELVATFKPMEAENTLRNVIKNFYEYSTIYKTN